MRVLGANSSYLAMVAQSLNRLDTRYARALLQESLGYRRGYWPWHCT
jgi:hypothetical protein